MQRELTMNSKLNDTINNIRRGLISGNVLFDLWIVTIFGTEIWYTQFYFCLYNIKYDRMIITSQYVKKSYVLFDMFKVRNNQQFTSWASWDVVWTMKSVYIWPYLPGMHRLVLLMSTCAYSLIVTWHKFLFSI